MKSRALRVAICAAIALALPIAGPGAQERRPINVTEGFEAYAGGKFDKIADAIGRIEGLTTFAHEVQRQAPAWIEAAGPDDVSRRRLVVATVALEAALAMPVRRADAAAAVELVQWACTLVRRNSVASEAEHLWHRTALAVLQRIMIPGLLEREWRDPIRQILRPHISHSQDRYPEDPAWTLAPALSVEVSTPASGGNVVGEDRIKLGIRAYEKLLTHKIIGPEAHLRTAHLKFRRDKDNADVALSDLDHVEASTTDALLLYLAAFVRGQIFERAGAVDRAADVYEAALTRWPGAQSAATALAAIRFRQDRRQEALALAQLALQKPARDDPWRHYGRGDYRLQELLERLRKTISDSGPLVPGSVSLFLVSGTIAALPDQQTAVPGPEQRPTFRADVSAVGVDVSVRVRNNPVPGLGADDFQLFDNGVRQPIETLSLEAVPLDVSMLLDVSGSMIGWAERLEQNAAQIAGLLKPTDRFRVICFGNDVREVLPMVSPAQSGGLASMPYSGGTSLYDALFLALVHQPGPDRRHLIVTFTDGRDTTSVLTADQISDAARRSESSVHLARIEPDYGNALPRVGPPIVRRPLPPELDLLVRSSGGEMYTPLKASIPAALESVLTDYRSRYLLRYSPVGVAPHGWHKIEVRVPRFPNATIRARNGYSAGPAR